jgi:SOS-response transcriptional repressor LexA
MSGETPNLDENIRNNLIMIMTKRRLSQRAVAQIAGIRAQVLNAYMTRKRGFGRVAIERLAKALSVSESYLIGGETTLATEALQTMMDRYTAERRTPILSIDQAAAWDQFTDIYRPGYALGWLPFKLRAENDIAVRMEDDSMEPEFKAGAVVILGQNEGDLNGKHVLAKVDNNIMCRRYRQFEHGIVLTPLNATYPEKVILQKDLHSLHVAAVAVAQVRLYGCEEAA